MGEGLIFLLSGPAGAGKNTIIKRVLFFLPDLEPVITYTTREPRPAEVRDVDHHFVTEEQFEDLISAGDLAEYQTISGHRYGTPKKRLEWAIEQRVDLISDCDVYGVKKLTEFYPENVVTIFVWVPEEVSRQRFIDRDGEDNPELAKRLDRQPMEMSRRSSFKYQVDNTHLWEAVCSVVSIVRAERCLASRRGQG